MSNCYEKYDLNEKTCTFVKKCPKVRDKTKCMASNEEKIKQKIELLKEVVKGKINQSQHIDGTIKRKIRSIRNSTIKKGYSDVTKNVNILLKIVEIYGTKKVYRNSNNNVFTLWSKLKK